MRFIYVIALTLLVTIGLTCNNTKEIQPSTYRQMRPSALRSYHQPVNIQVGWFSYQESKLVRSGNNDWQVVKNDETDKIGIVPQILIRYPETSDSIWLDMNIDNALLGKLIKHSLMTQVPIQRPFAAYFEAAACSKCHPSDVKIDF